MSTTSFKLNAAKFHLNRIINLRKTWKTILNPKARFKADVAVDGFLCEIMSTVDSLLHDVNDGLKLGIPTNEVKLRRVQREMHVAGFNVADLGDLNNLYSTNHWLSDLREFRNHSVHQRLLGMVITLNLPAGATKAYLPKPWIAGGRTKKEVISYLRDQLRNVRNLVKDVKKRLQIQ